MFSLQLGGSVFPSNAIINGRFALRSCVVNFRTEADTMDELASETVRLGRPLDADLRPAHLADDSLSAYQYRVEMHRTADGWTVDWVGVRWRCQSGRGNPFWVWWTTSRCS